MDSSNEIKKKGPVQNVVRPWPDRQTARAALVLYTQKNMDDFVVIAPVWEDSSKFHKMTYLHHNNDWEIHYYACTCVCHLFIHKEQMMYSVTIHTYKAVTPPC